MTENEAIREVDRARQAEQLLDHPLFKEAFQTLERQFTEHMISVPASDSESILKCHMLINCNRKLREFYQNLINNGKFAQAELDALERAKHFGGQF